MRSLDLDFIFFRRRRLRGIFRSVLNSRIGKLPFIYRLMVPDLLMAPLPQDERPVILVLSHVASRTGAPILGWNIIRSLSSRYRIISVMLDGGELEGDLRRASAGSTVYLGWADNSPAMLRCIAEDLACNHRPLYAIANSVETHALVPALTRAGIPVISLFHEFAAYTRPFQKLEDVFNWSSDVVFSSRLTARSAQDYYPGLGMRAGIHMIPQGRSEIPSGPADHSHRTPPAPLRPKGKEHSFVVLGAGTVHMRKGVETFIATAAAARRLRNDIPFLFVWIGDDFDPREDLAYSIYLDEQIKRSGLSGSMIVRPAVEDIDSLYLQADAFLLSSRLDPQPNVAIDAMSLGIPVICFEGAAGTAEILAADPATRDLVVPHLDAHGAAQALCRLAQDRDAMEERRMQIKRVAQAAFDMPSYIEQLDRLGRTAASRFDAKDARIIAASPKLDPAFIRPPHQEEPACAEAHPTEMAYAAMMQWRLWGGSTSELAHADGARAYRRACPGFHPGIYALVHEGDCLVGTRDPLAHWIEKGCPEGPWSRYVHAPLASGGNSASSAARHGLRSALHAHFHYPELASDLLTRLGRNTTRPDLFVTTDTPEKADHLRGAFAAYNGKVEVSLVTNRGRDIAPLLGLLADRLTQGDYDMFGHVHGKRSLAVDAELGERWRGFLWENLIGGQFGMIDTAAAAFAKDASLGLLIAEDPHVVGWNANRAIAETLAARMGIGTPLPAHFDFPLGTMFWARPAAFRPLLDLKLDADDYPPEPLPGDGTLLHAIERLIPFAARHAGLTVAGLRVPGTSW